MSVRAVLSAPFAQCRETLVRMKLGGDVGCVVLTYFRTFKCEIKIYTMFMAKSYLSSTVHYFQVVHP